MLKTVTPEKLQNQLQGVPMPAGMAVLPEAQPMPTPGSMAGGMVPIQNAIPTPKPQVPTPQVPLIGQKQLESDQGELERLRSTGAGVDQINNPFLRGLAKAGDIIGSFVAPNVMRVIPGTSVHHDMLEQRAEGNVVSDLAKQQTQAETGLRQAQTQDALTPDAEKALTPEQQTFADLLKNGMDPLEAYTKVTTAGQKPAAKNPEEQTFEAMIAAGMPAQEAYKWLKSNAGKDKSPDEATFEYLLGQGMTPVDALRKVNQMKPAITVAGMNLEQKKDEAADKAAKEQEANAAQYRDFESDMDRLAASANEIMNHPGLAGITGIRGALPNIPGGQAANAEAKLTTLKSQVAFGTLQKMRNASKTGGALGQVSERELALLTNSLNALDNAQSLDEFKKSLQGIIEFAAGAKDRARTALTGASQPAQQTQGGGAQTFIDGGRTYTIPAAEVEEFKKDHPNAKAR